jgi:DNA repair exonuclease SbcCD ATPase subunit
MDRLQCDACGATTKDEFPGREKCRKEAEAHVINGETGEGFCPKCQKNRGVGKHSRSDSDEIRAMMSRLWDEDGRSSGSAAAAWLSATGGDDAGAAAQAQTQKLEEQLRSTREHYEERLGELRDEMSDYHSKLEDYQNELTECRGLMESHRLEALEREETVKEMCRAFNATVQKMSKQVDEMGKQIDAHSSHIDEMCTVDIRELQEQIHIIGDKMERMEAGWWTQGRR